ncbi:ABC transporter permease [Kordiimonas sp. SCSIO 12610]|uniref:ABC transporter permease n=1 Tax=Kordiimonas sp. SCSIO 12610 TaxID=2829597 RepID=UPI00210ABA73|nr:ABC transporter permease [Kordiimonas sp. SCSIO 12610]UTW55676.1 ABC transporter permease [Kordiimonas sp. SCSIO 12610]
MSVFVKSFLREVSFLKHSRWDRVGVLWLPLGMMIVVCAQFGAGALRHLPVTVIDQDMSTVSRQLSAALDAAPAITVTSIQADFEFAKREVLSKRAYAMVLIPEEASERMTRGESANIILYYNSSFFSIGNTISREFDRVIRNFNAELASRQAALPGETAGVRPVPLRVTVRTLFNPYTSYELYILSFALPGLLHFIFMVSVTSALGRELRDGTIKEWLGSSSAPFWAIVGKIAPYLVIFMLWASVATYYLSHVRGFPIQGSYIYILSAYALMFMAYAGMALFFVGISKSMGRALSFTAIYAGMSIAFADTVFPIESASTFGQVWATILPFTWFLRAFFEQWVMGSSLLVSLPLLAILILFLTPGLLFGIKPYIKSAAQPETWGKE